MRGRCDERIDPHQYGSESSIRSRAHQLMKLGLVCGPDSSRIAHKLKVNGVSVNATDLVEDGGKAKLASLHELGLEPCQIAAFGFNPLTSDLKDRQTNEQLVEAALP